MLRVLYVSLNKIVKRMRGGGENRGRRTVRNTINLLVRKFERNERSRFQGVIILK
jgi:hypothetical protein